jgi:hypothetical protein
VFEVCVSEYGFLSTSARKGERTCPSRASVYMTNFGTALILYDNSEEEK